MGRTRPKFPFSVGDLDSHLIYGSLGPPESAPKRHLDRFSRFCSAYQRNQQTHRPPSVAIGRILVTYFRYSALYKCTNLLSYLLTKCMRCGLKILQLLRSHSINSICCGSVVELLYSKFKMYTKSSTNKQQIKVIEFGHAFIQVNRLKLKIFLEHRLTVRMHSLTATGVYSA